MPVFAPETLTRGFLDQLIPDRPAFIADETGGHTAWFNTLAMEADCATFGMEIRLTS